MKAALEALSHDAANDHGAKMFDLVGFYNTKSPQKALYDLFATQEQRCAFIVPGGDAYQNAGGRDAVSVVSHRDTDFSLLLCDRAWVPSEQAALIGGPDNLGVLVLKERVVAALSGQSLALPGVVLLPQEGGILELYDPRGGDDGRTCWDQPFTTYAGREKISVG
ncbi:hypothetical protein [Opitutus terrae]|uniref:hypothetical protein n=1 Tax=Opitutus terrae TaxID=107709 RepID=UPI0002EEE727|nr:hypothetical protein [Opitutus terrae]